MAYSANASALLGDQVRPTDGGSSPTNLLATINPSLVVSQPLAYLYLCWTGVHRPTCPS
ncbi:hypothetical protein V8E36_008116 [Tilletia maclaganii]